MENGGKRKLEFELVPDGCWYSNLRTILNKAQWDYIKEYAKKKANGRCMICGRQTQRLEAHEKWSYDIDTATQKLQDVIAVCHDCHSVIHIGRTSLKGNLTLAEDHYMKVNGVSYAEMKHDLGLANEEHKKRNNVSEWKLDLTWLKRFIEE